MENKISKLIKTYKEEIREHEETLRNIFLEEDVKIQMICINAIEEFIEDLEELERYYHNEDDEE